MSAAVDRILALIDELLGPPPEPDVDDDTDDDE